MSNLNISLIQTELHWEQPAANRAHFEEKISLLTGQTDLIVLPEMFNTGFTMNVEKVAETMNLHTHKWMKQMVQLSGAAITGSLIIRDGKNYFNRLIWIQPDGKEYHYDKVHLFSMGKEDRHFTRGKTRIIIPFKGIKFLPIICYDLRFPYLTENNFTDGIGFDYDVLIDISNWPDKRLTAWDTLLRSRAIDNHCFSIGVNRVGSDDNNITYSGHSAFYNPWGDRLAYSERDEILTFHINMNDLEEYRNQFPVYKDQIRPGE